jgi:hypothetical protein
VSKDMRSLITKRSHAYFKTVPWPLAGERERKTMKTSGQPLTCLRLKHNTPQTYVKCYITRTCLILLGKRPFGSIRRWNDNITIYICETDCDVANMT